MIKRKSWEEFRKTGLLWFVNMILHVFGWAIVYEFKAGGVIVYPARCKFRGFAEKINTEGYIAISEYMRQNGEALEKEARE